MRKNWKTTVLVVLALAATACAQVYDSSIGVNYPPPNDSVIEMALAANQTMPHQLWLNSADGSLIFSAEWTGQSSGDAAAAAPLFWSAVKQQWPTLDVKLMATYNPASVSFALFPSGAVLLQTFDIAGLPTVTINRDGTVVFPPSATFHASALTQAFWTSVAALVVPAPPPPPPPTCAMVCTPQPGCANNSCTFLCVMKCGAPLPSAMK